MSVAFISEESLRVVLRRHRCERDAFEDGVRLRLSKGVEDRESPVELSPALRAVASLLPTGLMAPTVVAGNAVNMAPVTIGWKMLSYLAFPAISLFLLVGAALFSSLAIRKAGAEAKTTHVDEAALHASARAWWRNHRWGAMSVFALSLAMGWFGATWLLFLFYIVSFGLLLYVLKSLAKGGLASRFSIGSYCIMGLALLGQLAGFPGIGDRDIHLLDQNLVMLTFFWGALALMILAAPHGDAPWNDGRWFRILGLLIVLIPLTLVFTNQFYRPATPARIKAYVESFDSAPYSSSSWSDWEIPARWTVERELNPELTLPRRLLAAEIAGEQNPFVLGDAFRTGLVKRDDIPKLKDYPSRLHDLLEQRYSNGAEPILSLAQMDWVVRAALMQDDLNPDQRDFLAKRLHATLENEFAAEYVQLGTVLRATQLLEAIGRPVDSELYGDQVHQLLRRFHATDSGGFQLAGGFKTYEKGRVGDLGATAYAVELMGIYGVPDGLNMDWVRSYLRPLSTRRSPQRWIAAVSLDRLNQLPEVTQPTWLETLYYERSLLAAAVLVGLCIYATISLPAGRAVVPEATS